MFVKIVSHFQSLTQTRTCAGFSKSSHGFGVAQLRGKMYSTPCFIFSSGFELIGTELSEHCEQWANTPLQKSKKQSNQGSLKYSNVRLVK